MTTTSMYAVPQTKNQIIKRLYDNNQISFEEMLVLLEKEYIYTETVPSIPNPWQPPYYITCKLS